jgi:hypothetical protein
MVVIVGLKVLGEKAARIFMVDGMVIVVILFENSSYELGNDGTLWPRLESFSEASPKEGNAGQERKLDPPRSHLRVAGDTIV